MSGCTALTIPPNVQGLSALHDLDLRWCEAMTIPPDVRGLTALQYLDLDGCKAMTTPPNVQGLTALIRLALTGCEALTWLPDVSGLTDTLCLGPAETLGDPSEDPTSYGRFAGAWTPDGHTIPTMCPKET
jgi:hypothetical protein